MLNRFSTLFMAMLIVFFAMAVPALACDMCGGDVIGVHVIAIDSPADTSVQFDKAINTSVQSPARISTPGIRHYSNTTHSFYAITDQAEERGGIIFASTCSVGQAGHFANNSTTYCKATYRIHQWIKG